MRHLVDQVACFVIWIVSLDAGTAGRLKSGGAGSLFRRRRVAGRGTAEPPVGRGASRRTAARRDASPSHAVANGHCHPLTTPQRSAAAARKKGSDAHSTALICRCWAWRGRGIKSRGEGRGGGGQSLLRHRLRRPQPSPTSGIIKFCDLQNGPPPHSFS